MTSGIRVRGATLASAFAEAALAAVARSIDPGSIEEREVREVRAHGDSVERLLVNWINECLYVHEVEAFAWRRVDFAVFDTQGTGAEPMRLHSFLHGEELDPGRHRPRAAGPVGPPRTVSIRPVEDGYEISLESHPPSV